MVRGKSLYRQWCKIDGEYPVAQDKHKERNNILKGVLW